MELIKDAYFGKSFMMIGDELPHCLNCSYCRANDGKGLHFNTMPEEINPIFTRIPVAVNCFYGDPFLQTENTLKYLDQLKKHEGPVILITKGDVTQLPEIYNREHYGSNLHIGLSTFGYCSDNKYDGGTWEQFLNNVEYLSKNNFNFHIEYRPIINGINDKIENMEPVFELAYRHRYDVYIAYSGLQVSDNLASRLKEQGIEFLPYEGKEFGLKKFVSKEVEDRLNKLSDEYEVPIFKKTSCLISSSDRDVITIHGGTRDYNAHYYRPNEVGCANCINRYVCGKYKNEQDSQFLYEEKDLHDIIPFDYTIEYAHNHVCSMFQSGLCKFPTNDCTHISGRILRIDEPVTTTDVRLIKWLTGFTVKAEFIELPYISEKWRI